jgi:hypothetical protein
MGRTGELPWNSWINFTNFITPDGISILITFRHAGKSFKNGGSHYYLISPRIPTIKPIATLKVIIATTKIKRWCKSCWVRFWWISYQKAL